MAETKYGGTVLTLCTFTFVGPSCTKFLLSITTVYHHIYLSSSLNTSFHTNITRQHSDIHMSWDHLQMLELT